MIPSRQRRQSLPKIFEDQVEPHWLELSARQWIYLDGGARHSVKGIGDTSLLLTILFDRQHQKGVTR
jgi:hypothetical protein